MVRVGENILITFTSLKMMIEILICGPRESKVIRIRLSYSVAMPL